MSSRAPGRAMSAAGCIAVAAACLVAPAQANAKPPRPGVLYQEAPGPPQNKRASNAANEALKREHSPVRLGPSALDSGVILRSSNAAPTNATKAHEKHERSNASKSRHAVPAVSAAALRVVVERAGGEQASAVGTPPIVWPVSVVIGLTLIAALLSLVERRRRTSDRQARAPNESSRMPAVAPPLAALGLLAVEIIVAYTSGPQPALVALELLLAPGLAATPFLPAELRRLPVWVAVVPILGAATAIVVLVSLSSFGIPLSPLFIRLSLLALSLVGFVWSRLRDRRILSDEPGQRVGGPQTLLLLGAAISLGIALQAQVLGQRPLSGEDWGQFLFFAQQISRHHALLITNPYWMLGGHVFPQDPGVPALYGSFLSLSGAHASSLLEGIWVFAVMAGLAVFAVATVLWGRVAGLVAAGMFAVIPMDLEMLSWHGLSNVAALSFVSLALLAAAMAFRAPGRKSWSLMLALFLSALLATHRISFIIAGLAIAVTFLLGARRRASALGRHLLLTLPLVVILGAGPAIDAARRTLALSGTQSYEVFLPTRLHWASIPRDLTWPVLVSAAAAAILIVGRRHSRRDATTMSLIGLLAAILIFTYAWVLHLPATYDRAAYFLPIPLALGIGLGFSRLPPLLLTPVLAIVLGLTAARGITLAREFRGFYSEVNTASLRGLALTASLARPKTAIVTDQCWGFLSTWLLQRPILAGLDPAIILPATEVAPARQAREILAGGRHTKALEKRDNIRFALVDPQCTFQNGSYYPVPRSGRLIFASTRLMVFELQPPSASSPPPSES